MNGLGVFICGWAVLFSCFWLCAAPEPHPPTVPAAEVILGKLSKVHPRLLASADDFEQLKKRIAQDATLQSWQSNLHKQAEEILGAASSRYEIPDGLRLLSTSRRVMNRLYTLGLLYCLEGDHRYAQRAWEELEAAANFPDWNPRHFLDTAEMTHAFAVGYDWLYEFWTPEQRIVLRQAIVEKGLKPALTIYRGRGGWPRARHNWNQVCNGGIGLGALALADLEPELCGELLHAALESLPIAMAEFAPDGAWKEGPGYWNYATAYNVVFLAAMQTALGTDFGLSRMPAFAQTGLFPVYLTGPLGRTFNYADGGDRAIHAPQMFWLARQFNQSAFAWYERQATTPLPQDLLWYQPGGAGPKAAGLPLNKYFRGAEVVTLRSEWENPKALFIGFKAGDNKANHSHLDLGSFVLDALGVRWAVDLGADDYNLPEYFGAKRWTYYRLRAEGQNTLVLNPGAGPDQEPAAAARIIRFQPEPQHAFAIADLTPAYRMQAQRVWRGLSLLDRDKVLIQDEVQADKPAEVWWFMHTPAGVTVTVDGRSAVLEQIGARLRAHILSPPDAVFQLMEPQPLPASPHPERQARNEGIKKLAIHLAAVTDSRLSVLLAPITSSDLEPAQALKLKALPDW